MIKHDNKKTNKKETNSKKQIYNTGLSILFLISFMLLFNNVYGFSLSESNINIILQIPSSSNYTNESMPMNHSQMSSMNMNHMDMMKRGDIGMGFNQSKISHQF